MFSCLLFMMYKTFVTEKLTNSICSSVEECFDGLQCNNNICKCPSDTYWNESRCVTSKYLLFITADFNKTTTISIKQLRNWRDFAYYEM